MSNFNFNNSDTAFGIEVDRVKTYRPGDTISGKVYLKPGKKLNVDSITIELHGLIHARSRIRQPNGIRVGPGAGLISYDVDEPRFRPGYKSACGDVTLFRRRIQLMRGPFTIASRQEWSFTLSFPLDCHEATDYKYSIRPSQQAYFNPDISQPLPPAIATFGSIPMNNDEDASIKYTLEANVHYSSAFRAHDTSTAPLHFCPYRSDSLRAFTSFMRPYARKVTISSDSLDPAKQHSLGGELVSAFIPHHRPSVILNLIAYLPRSGIVHQPLPVYLEFESHSHPNDTKDFDRPKVDIVRFEVLVETHVMHAVKHKDSRFKYNEDRVDSYNFPWTLAEWEGRHQLGDERVALHELTERMFVLKDVVPDFKTFNLMQTHKLRLKVTLECAKEKAKIEVLSGGCVVVAEDCRPLAAGESAELMQEGKEQLPSYSEAVSPSG